MHKIITFDATGTLLKLKYPLGWIYSEIAKDFGISSDQSSIENGFKLAWKKMSVDHPNFGSSSIGWKEWWKGIVFQSLGGNNINVDQRAMEGVANQLIDIFSSEKGWKLAPGTTEVLNLLKSSSIRMGVLSNFDPRLHGVLKFLNIDKYFDCVITSYEAGAMKPNPQIFRLVEEVFQLKPGLECGKSQILHVGDNLQFDYYGALNSGWDAALICQDTFSLNTTSPPVDREKVFKDLFELNEFFKKKLACR